LTCRPPVGHAACVKTRITPRPSRLLKPVRIAKAHTWLVVASAITLVLAFLLPGDWRLPTRILVGWNVGVASYLVHAYITASRFDLKRARERAASADEGALLVLVLTVAAAIASLAAIVAELGYVHAAGGGTFYLVNAALTILLSWTFIQVIFAFRYAHEYFGEGRDKTIGGLDFPGKGEPDYWDFGYFSFVVGMTFQVSDVQITSKVIRRTVLAHGLVSFFYSVAILALTVNIGSDLIKGGN
jgi:uncharacterized membrane protein